MPEKLSFYILTDTHFVSKQQWVEGKPVTNREKGDQIVLKLGPEILDSFFDKIIADKDTPFVIITGDLVNCGDRLSHEDFTAALRKLTAAGKQVFVTTATHDYCGYGDDENIFHAVRYTETGTEDAERVTRADLSEIYYEYGPEQADSVHESHSYSVVLQEGYRLIAINDDGNGRSHCGLFEDGLEWLQEQIDKAHAANETVFIVTHHPVIAPWPVYESVAPSEMYAWADRLRTIMCREHVNLIFTGHTHVHGIRKYTDDDGNYMYDITTTSLVSAAGKMRHVDIDAQNNTCDVISVGIDVINGVDLKGKSPRDFLYYINFGGLMEKLLPLVRKNFSEFLVQAEGFLNTDKLAKKKCLVKAAAGIAESLKMSTLAKLTKKYHTLTAAEIKKLKNEPVKDVAFTIVAHIFPGNAPFTPDTPEYKVIHGLALKGDKIMKMLHIDLEKYTPGISSAGALTDPFLYNTRTGDDDSIHIVLQGDNK